MLNNELLTETLPLLLFFKGLIGEICEEQRDCSSVIIRGQCLSSRCSCMTGYYASHDRQWCSNPRIGVLCDSEVDCQHIHNANCDAAHNCCACDVGMRPSIHGYVCVPRRLGESCVDDADCTRAVENSECQPTTGQCHCAAGYERQMDNRACVYTYTKERLLLIVSVLVLIAVAVLLNISIIIHFHNNKSHKRLWNCYS